MRQGRRADQYSDQTWQNTTEKVQRPLADNGSTCSMSRAGNLWDNSAIERFFSSLKAEELARKVFLTKNEARADLFDCIWRLYYLLTWRPKLGYFNPMEFEVSAMLA